jgi:ribosomal protein L33
MARGKGTNVHLYCKVCKENGKAITLYTTRFNKQRAASEGKSTTLVKKKYCPVCDKHQEFAGKDIKKGGTKALANAK